ncbi:Lar family restriction alleviation protein [Anaerosinus massiliensis]|uniref:Lar family restriction alleviation protein n=1 Tax=Massilibacillus massiliensis TaxID=1806837 RepID=UPI000DA5F593|nr:Lar family restriction alleviation protein [Massilibacillus massiliensis]
MSRLKPCPFCLGQVKIDENKAYGISYILCECGACVSFRGFEDKSDTVKKWNTRKSEVKDAER